MPSHRRCKSRCSAWAVSTSRRTAHRRPCEHFRRGCLQPLPRRENEHDRELGDQAESTRKNVSEETSANSRTGGSRVLARSSFYHLLLPKGGAQSIRRAKKSGNRRRLRLKRYADKRAPAFSTAPPPSSLLPDFSHYGMTVRSARPDFRSAPDLRTMPRRENEHESDRQFAAAAFKSLRKDVPLYK